MTRRAAQNMTTVGFIGSGAIGSTIARLAVEAGHQVVLSNSRRPQTLADTGAELGPRAGAAAAVGGGLRFVPDPPRGPETLGDRGGGVGPRASAATSGEAAAAGDIVVVTVP